MVKLGFSLSVMVIGMVIVFIGLIILIFSIIGVSKIIESATKKKEAPAEKVIEAPAAAEASTEIAQNAQDDQLIAVITAAIMAMEGRNGSSGLVVRSVVRKGNSWARAGRSEILGSR